MDLVNTEISDILKSLLYELRLKANSIFNQRVRNWHGQDLSIKVLPL